MNTGFAKLPFIKQHLVMLYLVANKLKPATTFMYESAWLDEVSFRDFFDYYQLPYTISQKQPVGSASYNQADLQYLAEQNDEVKPMTKETARIFGLMYGYPRHLVEYFVDHCIEIPYEQQVKADIQQFFDEPWFSYIFYRVRPGHEYEDSALARSWASFVLETAPDLHNSFIQETREVYSK